MKKLMNDKPQRGGFVMQAGILAMAGIICRIIGILYRSPLTGIIGDEGNGYYTTAYNLYAIILLISSYSIPSAVSKVISARLAVNEYRNAFVIFKCAVIYVLVVGGVAALFTWGFAGILTGEASARVLRIFAPTIFLSGLLGVLRGYFQAHGTMIPTSLSQIIEQIVNACMSIGMALLFISVGGAGYFKNDAVAGACGSAVGTGAGVTAAFLFMLVVFLKNKEKITEGIKRDKTRRTISNSRAFIIIIAMVTPIVLSTFIYNFSTSLNQEIFSFFQGIKKGLDEAAIATEYGIFAGKAVVITNIPIALAAAMSSAIIPVISASMASGKDDDMRDHIKEAVHCTLIVSLPAFVGMLVLSKPVMAFLFPQPESLTEAASLLSCISLSVVLYSLSTVTNGSLQAVGKVLHPVRNAALALVAQTVLLVILLQFTDLGIYALAVAMVAYSGMMCVFNQISLRITINYHQEIKKSLIKPLIASAIMGVAAKLIYSGLVYIIPSGRLALVITIILAIPVYFIALIYTGGVTREDIIHFPGGRTLLSLFNGRIKGL